MNILSGRPSSPRTYSLFISYSKFMNILSEVSPPSPSTYPVLNSYSKLMNILSGVSSPSTYSLFNSYSKLMDILSGVSLLQYVFKTREYPLWGLPPFQVFLIQHEWISSLGSPSSTIKYSLFNSYSKLMNILSGVPLLLQFYMFLIQFLLKTDEYPLWGLLPPLVHIPQWILIQNWWISSLGSPSSPSTCSLFNSY